MAAEKKQCEGCAHFKAGEQKFGECLRYPPAIIPVTHVDMAGHIRNGAEVRFPRVMREWYCGEYAPAPSPLRLVS